METCVLRPHKSIRYHFKIYYILYYFCNIFSSFGGGADDGEEKGEDNDAGLFAVLLRHFLVNFNSHVLHFVNFSKLLPQGGTYDAEDDEADRMYQAVDEYVDLRRKKRREEREKEVTKNKNNII